jgi:hypothetical protein
MQTKYMLRFTFEPLAFGGSNLLCREGAQVAYHPPKYTQNLHNEREEQVVFGAEKINYQLVM